MAKQKEEQQHQQELTIEDLPLFEAKKGVDLAEYEGSRAKIEEVVLLDTFTPYNEIGEYVEGLKRPIKVIKVITGKITDITTQEGEVVSIKASELFNLKYDGKTNEWGYSSSEKSKLQKFLKRQKVLAPKNLIGTTVILKVILSKKGGQFLGFVTA